MGIIGDTFRALLARHRDHPLAWRAFRTIDSAQSERYRLQSEKLTMWGSVENLRRNGFMPGAIIDAGAYRGRWMQQMAEIYPNTPILMLEANPNLRSALERAAARVASTTLKIALLGPENLVEHTFYVADADTGSSVLDDITRFPRRAVTLPMRTLDSVVGEHDLRAPLFLKLDLQGYEYDVLRGAAHTLARTEVVLCELSFLPYYRETKLAGEVICWMQERGFVLYDVCSQMRRESDLAVWQADVLFVRADSQLRAKKPFFDAETWSDEKLAKANAEASRSNEQS